MGRGEGGHGRPGSPRAGPQHPGSTGLLRGERAGSLRQLPPRADPRGVEAGGAEGKEACVEQGVRSA